MKKLIFILLAAVLVGGFAAAQTHDAHEHGIAQLQIVLSETELEIVLIVPGADFIGFEHSDLSHEEEEALEERIEEIEQLEQFIRFRSGWFNTVSMQSIEVLLRALAIPV